MTDALTPLPSAERDASVLELTDGYGAWRENRDPGWVRDIGYRVDNILNGHRYAYERKGIKPDDPGWHECSCGDWQGYWSGFQPHVADRVRSLIVSVYGRVTPPEVVTP